MSEIQNQNNQEKTLNQQFFLKKNEISHQSQDDQQNLLQNEQNFLQQNMFQNEQKYQQNEEIELQSEQVVSQFSKEQQIEIEQKVKYFLDNQMLNIEQTIQIPKFSSTYLNDDDISSESSNWSINMDEIKNKIEMEDEDDMEKGNPLTKFKTAHEKDVEIIQKEETKDERFARFGISNNVDDTQMQPCGTLISICDKYQLVISGCQTNILNLESIVFRENKDILGKIDDVFGNINDPKYVVLIDKYLQSMLDAGQIILGENLYISDKSTVLQSHEIKKIMMQKGCDASNQYDEEIQNPEFSDDEQEKQFKQKKNKNDIDEETEISKPQQKFKKKQEQKFNQKQNFQNNLLQNNSLLQNNFNYQYNSFQQQMPQLMPGIQFQPNQNQFQQQFSPNLQLFMSNMPIYYNMQQPFNQFNTMLQNNTFNPNSQQQDNNIHNQQQQNQQNQ